MVLEEYPVGLLAGMRGNGKLEPDGKRGVVPV